MLFNSIEFLVFFPIVVGVYFALPHRLRWVVLLVSSYCFYMAWEPGYACLLAISTVVDYFAALVMARRQGGRRRLCLLTSLSVNLGLLFFFKYYNFFRGAFETVFTSAGFDVSMPVSKFLLPVGISFYTFQTLGYTIDVYRGGKEPERHFGIFAVYVAFFPQLVAGPIERAARFLPQFRVPVAFDYERVTDGLKLMVWGMVKKVVIADRLAVLVDQVYGQPGEYSGLALTVATVFFAFQIYCDFSGYCDIAIGAAQVMGFSLMQNFNRPYHARSIPEFWRRWHISLSTWFRDYVFIPLGGSRVTVPRWTVNVVIVFVVSGLWHGANWTFVAWGGIHAFYMLLSYALKPVRERLAVATGITRAPRTLDILRIATTFVLVCFSWILFRASTISDAAYIIGHLFTGWGVVFRFNDLTTELFSLGLAQQEFLIAVAGIAVLEGSHLLQRRGTVRGQLARLPIGIRWAAYSAALWAILVLGVFGNKEFIYFTF